MSNKLTVELAECIGRYMSETIYRRRLSPVAADFVASRDVELIPPQLHYGTDPTWPGPGSGNSQPEEESGK